MNRTGVNAISYVDWLLIIAFICAPMDSLRFIPKVGIAEMAMALWCAIKLIDLKVQINLIAKFWLLFLLILFCGVLVGISVAPEESTAIPDYFIYVFFAMISIMLSTGMSRKSLDYLTCFLARLGKIATGWHLFLFLVAQFVPKDFPGITFWFYSKYTGGAENPNKLSVYLCEVFFINFFCLLKAKRRKERFFSAFCMFVCFFLGGQTQSSMFYVAVLGSMIVCLYLLVLDKFKKCENKSAMITSTMVLLTSVLILFGSWIFHKVYDWIASDSNGLGRFRLFASIIHSIRKSAIVGLGPGMHALDGQWTYHNAYLEILAMSGFVGLFLFLGFICAIVKKSWKWPDLLVLFIPLLVYSVGSFAVRNIEFWMILVFVYTIAGKRNEMRDRKNE